VLKINLTPAENRQLEGAQSLTLSDRLDFNDLPARDREAEHHEESSTRSNDHSHGSVHERRLRRASTALSGPAGHGCRAADLQRVRTHRSAVASKHDVRVEYRQK